MEQRRRWSEGGARAVQRGWSSEGRAAKRVRPAPRRRARSRAWRCKRRAASRKPLPAGRRRGGPSARARAAAAGSACAGRRPRAPLRRAGARRRRACTEASRATCAAPRARQRPTDPVPRPGHVHDGPRLERSGLQRGGVVAGEDAHLVPERSGSEAWGGASEGRSGRGRVARIELNARSSGSSRTLPHMCSKSSRACRRWRGRVCGRVCGRVSGRVPRRAARACGTAPALPKARISSLYVQ